MRVHRSFHGELTTHEYSVPPGQAARFLIGRPREGAPPPHLNLAPDPTASRSHAALVIEVDGAAFLEDLGSTLGTQLNGREIKGARRVRLQSGDVARLGDTLLSFDTPFETQATSSDAANTIFDLRIAGEMDACAARPSLIVAPSDKSTLTGAKGARLDAIYDLPLQFAAQTRLLQLLQLIVTRLVELIPGATRGALVLCESGGDRLSGVDADNLVPQAFYPLDGPPVVSRVLARRAMDERAGFIWQRGEEEENIPVSGSILRFGIQSGMYAPLLWQDGALGAVCVDNGDGHAAFSGDDLRLMLMVGQYAAMAVANQQLQEGMGQAWAGALEALTAALASRDYETQSHCYRTVELTVALARALNVPEEQLPDLARGALLHDIGKIGIADDILFKPGPLSPDERATMQNHAQLGHEMLQHIRFFRDALPIVLYHHERYDGSGYPLGLRAEQIPRGARIFHVVDLYDALTQKRPYKDAWTHEEAIYEIRSLAGAHCDPEVVAALENLDPAITARIRELHDFSPGVREMLGRPSG